MRTKCFLLLVVLFTLISSAVMADRPALRAALKGALDNSSTDPRRSGDPATEYVDAPVPVIPGRFRDKLNVFPVVNFLGGSEKDKSDAEKILNVMLLNNATRWNFSKKSGIKPPLGSVVFTLTLSKEVDQIVATSNHSNNESSTGSSRRYSNGRSESSSSSNSSESTFVNSNAVGEVDFLEMNGSITGLGGVDGIDRAKSERIASAHQDSNGYSYNYSSRSGSNSFSSSSSSGSSYRSTANVAEGKSSRFTIKEAVMVAVLCAFEQAINEYNLNHCSKSESVPAAKKPEYASGYSGDLKYIAVDE